MNPAFDDMTLVELVELAYEFHTDQLPLTSSEIESLTVKLTERQDNIEGLETASRGECDVSDQT